VATTGNRCDTPRSPEQRDKGFSIQVGFAREKGLSVRLKIEKGLRGERRCRSRSFSPTRCQRRQQVIVCLPCRPLCQTHCMVADADSMSIDGVGLFQVRGIFPRPCFLFPRSQGYLAVNRLAGAVAGTGIMVGIGFPAPGKAPIQQCHQHSQRTEAVSALSGGYCTPFCPLFSTVYAFGTARLAGLPVRLF
jgi:hypothetical protein